MKRRKKRKANPGLGLLQFQEKFGTEQACIEHLARLRWPDGFVCPSCKGTQGYQLRLRPRVWQCAKCAHQESSLLGP
jgi:hypothetical protein